MKKDSLENLHLPVVDHESTVISTFNGNIENANVKVRSDCPSKFNYSANGKIKWLLMDFDKPYDLLL